MRPAGLLHLYGVRLRARLVQELFAIFGIAVGVALVFIALVANTSLTGSVRAITRGLVGDGVVLEVVARGPEGIDARLLRAVRRIDGVVAAAASVEAPANLVGPRGQRSVLLLGADPRDAGIVGPLTRRFVVTAQADRVTQASIVALPAPLADALGVVTGQTVQIESGGRIVTVPLANRLQRSDFGSIVDSPIAIAPLRFAQRASGMPGRVSRIIVKPAPGRERAVQAALLALVADRANVWSTDHDVRTFERAAYPTTTSTTVFSAFATLVGFLLAFTGVLLTVPQRRRFVVDLRTAGHEPWVVLQLLLFDAFMLGAAGSLVGLLVGDQASRRVFGDVPGYLTFAFAIGEQRIVSWQSVAAAVAAGMAAACIAVLLPVRDLLLPRRGRRSGLDDGFGPGRWGLAGGCATLALATATMLLAPQVGVVALMMITVAALLFLPTALRGASAAFEAVTHRLRTPVPTLAALELRSRSTRARALALAATGTVAVLATVAAGGSHADLQRGLDASASAIDGNGDVWVTFPGTTNAFATTPLHASMATRATLRALPGVDHVAVYRGSFLDIDDHRTWIQAPPRSAPMPIAASEIHGGDPATANARLRAGGWTVLSREIAERLDVGVGDRVTLPTPVPTRLRVAAISTNLGWPSGAVVMSADDYAHAWGTRVPTALQLRLSPGSSPTHVAAAVRRVLPPTLPALVETRQERIARHYAASRQGLQRLTQVSVVVLIAAIVAMTGAMAGMIWQRRPTIAAFKVHGYPERELWGALLLESALLLGTGCMLGAVFGLFTQAVMTRALVAITDFPIVYVAAGTTAIGILLIVTIVAVAMIALPGWLAVRVRATPGGAT
jgi:putative ABC transport system permease protein